MRIRNKEIQIGGLTFLFDEPKYKNRLEKKDQLLQAFYKKKNAILGTG